MGRPPKTLKQHRSRTQSRDYDAHTYCRRAALARLSNEFDYLPLDMFDWSLNKVRKPGARAGWPAREGFWQRPRIIGRKRAMSTIISQVWAWQPAQSMGGIDITPQEPEALSRREREPLAPMAGQAINKSLT